LEWDEIKGGVFEGYTYLSSIGACFRGRRFPIEIIRPGRYMKIKSKDFGYSISSPGNS
jgi:hypothetical protein